MSSKRKLEDSVNGKARMSQSTCAYDIPEGPYGF